MCVKEIYIYSIGANITIFSPLITDISLVKVTRTYRE